MERSVDAFIDELDSVSPDFARIVITARDVFCSQCAECVETIKYGGIVYLIEDELIGGIFAYSKHVSIEFSHGASFSDPTGVLLGKGAHRRHLSIAAIGDLDVELLQGFIEQALAS